jgi:hypothetical protein
MLSLRNDFFGYQQTIKPIVKKNCLKFNLIKNGNTS